MGYASQIEKTFAYTKDNVFFIPPESRWSYIIENAKQDDIALKIDTALYTIKKTNPALKGALPDNYYSRLHIDTSKIASLLDEINRINTDDEENDIIGRVYEYFLSKFALAEGKYKGLIVDYIGIKKNMNMALKKYTNCQKNGTAVYGCC